MNFQLRSPLARSLFGLTLLGFALFLLFPVVWMVLTSFKPEGEIFRPMPTILPTVPTLANFTRALRQTALGGYLFNSLVTAGGSALLTTALAAYAAYGFAKFTFRLRGPLMALLISAQMFPFGLLLVGLYPMLVALGLINTRIGLVLSYIVFALPGATYILYSYFVRLPHEIIEAARVDGAGELHIAHAIVLRLSLPGLIAVGMYSFMWAWNDVLFSLTLLTTQETRTIGPGLLLEFLGEMQNDWGGLMAAATVASLPVVAVFLALQRHFIQGLTAGAIK